MSAIATDRAPGATSGSAARRDPATVLSALEDQLDCYRRLDELAAEQSRHVAGGDTERLLAVLQRRQQYADSVAELEQTVADVKRGWPASVAGWTDGERAHAGELLTASKRLLESITARDAQDMLALEQRRQTVAAQLNQSLADERSVRQINRRYAAAAYGPGPNRRQMDLRR